MANKYGEAALIAARLDVPERVTAAERWDVAVRQLYPEKPYMQKKSAPKAVFLALCEAGVVKGVAGSRLPGVGAPTSNRNAAYALRAVELLRAGTHRTVTALWAELTEGEELPHAAQMDVVLALWKNGLIEHA
jgi:hypothetical protein